MRLVVLAGGTGGAKLAAGMQELAGRELSVIANTGDDVEVLGVHVSPDPDLVTYWLSDQIDEKQGWGIRDDTYTVFERLAALGAPAWFRLSDRDLATCLYRRFLLDEGVRLTEAQGRIARGLGVEARVLPMCDERVRTRVRTPEGWREFQEYLITYRAEPPIEEVEFAGIAEASVTAEGAEALGAADAILIGPSNPVISIGPILAVPGMREAIAASPAPVVAVSPFVAGRAIKGPTEAFMAAARMAVSASGVVAMYEGLIDGIVVDADDPDPPPEAVAALAVPTLMDDSAARRRVAEQSLDFARSLSGGNG